MSIAVQWAASRKERMFTKTAEECFDAAMADKARWLESKWLESKEADLAAFQRDVQRQREVAREARRRDAMPYSEAEELTLP